MSIPLIDFKAQYASLKDEIDAAIGDVMSRASFVQRQEVAMLEREFADYCGVAEAIGVSSGLEAIQLSLVALGIGTGDEVITTPLSFISTVEAISQVGATPVFVDIDPVSSNIDASNVEAAITSRTKAIVPVHLNG